jgi:predicted metalloprotease
MRWQDFRRSDNVEELGSSSPSGFGGGGLRLGGGAIAIIVIVSLLLGKNPLDVLALLSDGGTPPQVQTQAQAPAQPESRAPTARDAQKDFVRAVLGDTEDFWGGVFQQMGSRYQPPKLGLFQGQIGSACGFASAAMGPFYCAPNREVYLDLEFFHELSQRFGAPGDFARAYVIAHEIGHHVQNELGVMSDAQKKMSEGSDRGRNALSVRLELQADCLAGVWGHSAAKRGMIDAKDIDAGIAAAASVGDDRLQRQSRGYVVPESFTHGSSAQRAKWFRTGLDSGDLRQCNTFASREL